MQECLSQSAKSQVMPFGEFLAALFQAFNKEGVRFCVLRNYEDFPTNNIGRDVDFLINRFDLPIVCRILRSIQGIRIVGYTERHYVASFFLANVSTSPQSRALQLDFDLSLTWRGLPYLSAEAVLISAIPRSVDNLTFFIPSPVHEAIISLLASLLVGGWLNEKYLSRVRQTFADKRSEVIASLLPQFGLRTATQLMDSVFNGDLNRILGLVRSLRLSLVLRNLVHKPIQSAFALVRHYGGELTIRYSPKTRHVVCIFGLDVSTSNAIIDTLMPLLQSTAVLVERRHLGQAVSLGRQSRDIPLNTVFFDNTPRSWLASITLATMLLTKTWVTQFSDIRNLTLHIYDGCYQELSVNPRIFRYGGPMWFALLISRSFPTSDLFILLDISDTVLQAGSQGALATDNI